MNNGIELNEQLNEINRSTPFVENESYKHKMAKQVLKEWFEETRKPDYSCIGDISFRPNRTSGIFLEYPICCNITTPARTDEEFVRVTEIMEKGYSFIDAYKKFYPKLSFDCDYNIINCDICKGDWDILCQCNEYKKLPILTYEEFYKMTNYRNTYKTSWEINWDEIEGGWDEYVPTYDECVNIYNSYPIAIIDMVCSHKGAPCIGIEICHKNPVSQEKINKLKEIGVHSLIEIDAEWILKQTKRPDKLRYKRLI
jgi:hypothetical protein